MQLHLVYIKLQEKDADGSKEMERGGAKSGRGSEKVKRSTLLYFVSLLIGC